MRTLLLFVCCINLSFGQKKELYLNDNLEYISKEAFEKIKDKEPAFNIRFDLDSCFITANVLRHKEGKISKTKLDEVKDYYKKLTNSELEGGDVLLINYYPDDKARISRGYINNFKTKYFKYRKNIENLKFVKQLFVYQSPKDFNIFGKKMNWQPDTGNLIENLFFPIQNPRGGFVMLDSKGNYIINRGEYCYYESLVEDLIAFSKKENQ